MHFLFRKYVGPEKRRFLKLNTLLLYGHRGPILCLFRDPVAMNFTNLVKGMTVIIIMHLVFTYCGRKEEEFRFEIMVFSAYIVSPIKLRGW